MAKQKRTQNTGKSRNAPKQQAGNVLDFTKPRKAPQSAPKAQTKPKKIDMDAAVEESTPANVMWKLGILLCVAMIVIGLLFASINGGSVYVGEDAKPTPTPTPPVASTMPDEGDATSDGSDTGDGADTGTSGDQTTSE